MHPIPCSHCGINFMRKIPNSEEPKLCNSCILREEKRTPRKEDKMEKTCEILIKCPRKDQVEIEEICINEGKDFTKYFMELHYVSQSAKENVKENHSKEIPERKKKGIKK